MCKIIQYSIIVLLTLCVGGTIFAQLPMGASSQKGDIMTVTIDSIDSDFGYIMVTVMTDGFEPFDYQMRQSKHGKISLEMRKPANNKPFSVMAFEDVNINRRLDLNEYGIPGEKSAVRHLAGNETEVTLTLRHYDMLLKPNKQNNDTVPVQIAN